MKTLIIYYSFTENNSKLANAMARKLNAACTELKESRKRTVFTIVMDVFFNRIPNIQRFENAIDQYEHLIFVAPVWFGKIGTPLRAVFNYIKAKEKIISFVSLSAGADGINPGLKDELIKRTATTPKAIINLLIIDLLPANPKPNRKMLDEYKITVDEADMLADKVMDQLKPEL
jgi:hypothetical protein